MTATTVVGAEQNQALSDSKQRRRVGWSAFLGTAIEYYDFTLYGIFGPIYFTKLFFPLSDPDVAIIAVLAVYAAGFLARPLGGIVFSHFGDRIGRKPVMIISMTTMGIASTSIGLLPTYQTLGIWAPLLLVTLRIVQGFALGGESAGANVFATEVGRHGQRGFFSSLTTTGIFAAWIVALVASQLVNLLPPEQAIAWGWRVPFLFSLALVILGIWMRLRIEESAVFLASIRRKRPARVPFLEVLKLARKETLIVILAGAAESANGFFFLVFGFTYALRNLHIPLGTLLMALLIGNLMSMAIAPLSGMLCDRVGRRLVLGGTYFVSALYVATFYFPLLKSGNTVLIYLAMIFPVGLLAPLTMGVIASFYSEQFKDARLRYSGVGFGRGLGTSLGGGLMPLIATSLMNATGGSVIGPIAWFGTVMLSAVVSIMIARETKDDTLR